MYFTLLKMAVSWINICCSINQSPGYCTKTYAFTLYCSSGLLMLVLSYVSKVKSFLKDAHDLNLLILRY